jgi:hypothetical protein
MLLASGSPTDLGGRVANATARQGVAKVSCEDCYFRQHLLCALPQTEPCATFRPGSAELKPPQQLQLVFRSERRTRAAWAFPSAQEQAALYV